MAGQGDQCDARMGFARRDGADTAGIELLQCGCDREGALLLLRRPCAIGLVAVEAEIGLGYDDLRIRKEGLVAVEQAERGRRGDG